MPVDRLKKYLEENDVRFVTIRHSPAFTAQEIAALAHIPGKELAKTVMVKLDGKMAMVVLPAEFADIFPKCEVGAMPPFGNLWDMSVFVDEHLREDEEIVFNAGSHTELVRLSYADFERLVKPVIGYLSTRN